MAKANPEKRKVEKWLRLQIYGRRSEGSCERIVLKHLSAGKNGGQEVQTFFLEKRVEEKELTDLVEGIVNSSQEDADGIGGTQKYVLTAWFRDDDEIKSRLVFRVKGSEGDDDDDPIDSEPPTKIGLVAQQMRHNEIIMRSANFAMGSTLASLNRDNESLREENRKLREERRDYIEHYEQLLSLHHERELKSKEHEFMLKAKGQAWEKITLIAPALVNRMMGKKLLPEKTTPEAMAFKSLVDSITPEQMSTLQTVFTPDQVISFFQLYEANRERDPNGQALTVRGDLADGRKDPS
jgi:hypothetical protein